MTLDDLIALYRSNAGDAAEPYLASDEDLKRWLNESEEEAALRANLLFESTDASMCQIAVTAATAVYTLSQNWFRITKVRWVADGDTEEDAADLPIVDRYELDRLRVAWRTNSEAPVDIVVDDTQVQLGCLPDTDGTLYLEGYRKPAAQMTGDSDSPEIGSAHHRHLVKWAEYRAFGRPDSDLGDPQRSQRALDEFTRQFGERPDADRLRASETNRPHFNKVYLP